ncbi:hypothetical protein CpipJ_CPIJ015490 [Culex quinquefasciatus]|uniref:Transmembrane protein n=1 Tax=Culex quinquefasciatus TaxID=7176 RepID=B0X7H4_CULQU|nr:hypothetical protein CpipJ_CPIJ015490 [Culex quinquefasciatus]|eukprot:XP_001865596.1 hypothetical protein CpipJ_CPIJ015490 [Culex quinquefasciatus]
MHTCQVCACDSSREQPSFVPLIRAYALRSRSRRRRRGFGGLIRFEYFSSGKKIPRVVRFSSLFHGIRNCRSRYGHREECAVLIRPSFVPAGDRFRGAPFFFFLAFFFLVFLFARIFPAEECGQSEPERSGAERERWTVYRRNRKYQ